MLGLRDIRPFFDFFLLLSASQQMGLQNHDLQDFGNASLVLVGRLIGFGGWGFSHFFTFVG